MKRTNLVNKSVKLLMSIIIASSIVAMGSNGTVAATLTNNDAIISNIVMAAETTPLPKQWSTAEVYKDARYGETWGGPAVDSDDKINPMRVSGTQTRWEWLKDMNYVFTVEDQTTDNGTNLKYQWLMPVDMTGYAANDSYMSYTDKNEPIRKWFSTCQAGTVDPGDTLWSYMDKMLQNAVVASNATAIGDTLMDTQEDSNYARLTVNITRVNSVYGTIEKGYCTFIWQKATGKIFNAQYYENEKFFDNERALTVIYSYLPIVPIQQ